VSTIERVIWVLAGIGIWVVGAILGRRAALTIVLIILALGLLAGWFA